MDSIIMMLDSISMYFPNDNRAITIPPPNYYFYQLYPLITTIP